MSAPSAVSTAVPTLYPGEAPPFAVITTTDHSGLIIMATVLGLAIVVVSSAIRYYVRKETVGLFARDDIVYQLAAIFSVFQSAAVLTGVKHGLGKSVEDIGSDGLLQLQNFLWWQIISSIDMVTEVSLFLVSVYIIQGLHMPWKRKATIIFAFGLRLPVIIPTALRLYDIDTTISSNDPTFDAAIVIVWTQIEMDYALIGATIPCLKPFIKSTSTTFGATAVESPSGTAALKSAQTYGLSSIISSGRMRGSKILSETSQNERGDIRKTPQHTIQQLYADETYGTEKTITDCTKSNDHHSMESYGSEQIIIRHAVDVTVDHA